MSTTQDGEGKQIEGNNDPYGWKAEFDFPADEIENRGEPVGYARFVAFKKPDDTDGTLSLMSDLSGSPEFAAAFVETMVKNDRVFDYMKALMNKADRMRKIKNMDLGDILGEMFGRSRPGRVGDTFGFPSGGQSFGEMDELSELFGRPKRRSRNPLESLLERLGERGDRPKIGIEAKILEIKRKPGQSVDDAIRDAIKNDMNADENDGNPLSRLAELLRNMTNGAGCDCPRCTEMRERKKRESESGTETPGE